MATLGKPMPGFDINYDAPAPAEGWGAFYDRQLADLANLRTTGKVIQWQVADGYASYFVQSEKPLVLRHIGAGDGYAVDPALIRGLRLSDVRAMMAREAAMSKLFGRS